MGAKDFLDDAHLLHYGATVRPRSGVISLGDLRLTICFPVGKCSRLLLQSPEKQTAQVSPRAHCDAGAPHFSVHL